MANIPAFYRIFFLYIDPLINLSGSYILFFDHPTYVKNGTPNYISVDAIDPIVQYLLLSLGSFSLCIFGLQTLLLQQYRDVKIWKIVMFSILLTDLGLIYTIYAGDPKGFWDIGGWSGGDWSNVAILSTVISIRSAFLLTV